MSGTNRIAKLLAAGRRRKKLSQSELAQKIGVHTRSIEGWESGLHVPNPLALKALAKELGISEDELKAERWDARARRRRARARQRSTKEDAAGAVA